jgi:hypothetical protein
VQDRNRGQVSLHVFEHLVEEIGDYMRRIIEIRNSPGLRRPVVSWQFLVFRFNQHEREKAVHMAREIGADRRTFLAPYLLALSFQRGLGLRSASPTVGA